MQVVFLYTELAEYFIKCCETLSLSAQVHIVRWPVNKEAPFEFKFGEKLKVYEKNQYSLPQLEALVAKINPDIIVCSGWIDKDYLKIVGQHAKKIPTVMTCDTHWKGSLKQRFATLLSRFFILPKFSHAWVPGAIQKKYVLKLGFKKENIREGFYSCDLEKFNAAYRIQNTEARVLKKRFLYVGRYYQFKGITDLWQAFIEFQSEANSNWELWCLGTGNVDPIEHPQIKHFGFVQPSELESIIKDCSIFVLPSRFEPWGVVVHEYAASGFPMILSNEVGAASSFLKEGENGFSFTAGNVAQLKQTLKKMSNLSDKELISMSVKSHGLAQQISPEIWARTILDILYENKKK